MTEFLNSYTFHKITVFHVANPEHCSPELGSISFGVGQFPNYVRKGI